MSISFNSLLLNIADSKYFDLSSSKKADAIYKPKYYNYAIDWLILVFKSGLFEQLAYLKVDAQWQFINFRSNVNIVIIILIKPPEKNFRDEKWQLAPPVISLPIIRANLNPNRSVSIKIQEICITQNIATSIQVGTIAPYTIIGKSLILKFQNFYFQMPVTLKRDIIFISAILSKWANKFWHIIKPSISLLIVVMENITGIY